jgi:glycosyltransferase involved in cell wall biosynthesis
LGATSTRGLGISVEQEIPNRLERLRMLNQAKTVLYLSPFFYPELISTGKYNSFLVKSLLEENADVLVLASHPLYPNWKPKRTKDSMEGVTIFRGGDWIRYPEQTILRRVALELWYALFTLFKSFEIRARNIDSIVFIFPPTIFLFGVNFLFPKQTKRIGIVHDIQTAVYSDHLQSPIRRLLSKIIRIIERASYLRCDLLIFLSNSMMENAVARYGLNRSKCVVHYPFNTLDASVKTSLGNSLEKYFQPGYKHVVYSGALGHKQHPMGLLRAFERLLEMRPDVQCHFFSRGPLFDVLLGKRNLSHSNRLHFHDLVPEEDLMELYSRSDIQVLPQELGSANGAFPSKLPNLIASRVPVLAICNPTSEVAQILDESHMGRIVGTWDFEVVAQELSKFLIEVDNGEYPRDSSLLNKFICSKFDIKEITRRILSFTRCSSFSDK